uniref:Uncharacterized protein n=1 Tax=Micrurus lemniscatus lemniscatus TaxID=129467 RepID=A0A2D4IIT4_MICLE
MSLLNDHGVCLATARFTLQPWHSLNNHCKKGDKSWPSHVVICFMTVTTYDCNYQLQLRSKNEGYLSPPSGRGKPGLLTLYQATRLWGVSQCDTPIYILSVP